MSIAEQADVDLYVDIEISTKPEMYQCNEAVIDVMNGSLVDSSVDQDAWFDFTPCRDGPAPVSR